MLLCFCYLWLSIHAPARIFQLPFTDFFYFIFFILLFFFIPIFYFFIFFYYLPVAATRYSTRRRRVPGSIQWTTSTGYYSLVLSDESVPQRKNAQLYNPDMALEYVHVYVHVYVLVYCTVQYTCTPGYTYSSVHVHVRVPVVTSCIYLQYRFCSRLEYDGVAQYR